MRFYLLIRLIFSHFIAYKVTPKILFLKIKVQDFVVLFGKVEK